MVIKVSDNQPLKCFSVFLVVWIFLLSAFLTMYCQLDNKIERVYSAIVSLSTRACE